MGIQSEDYLHDEESTINHEESEDHPKVRENPSKRSKSAFQQFLVSPFFLLNYFSPLKPKLFHNYLVLFTIDQNLFPQSVIWGLSLHSHL